MIPRQYSYCEQTTSESIVSALYRLDVRCTVYDTAPISILCANDIRPIWNLYCSIVSALYQFDIRCTLYMILGQYPYCVQTIITQYWANTCLYRKRIPIQYRANFRCFLGEKKENFSMISRIGVKESGEEIKRIRLSA